MVGLHNASTYCTALRHECMSASPGMEGEVADITASIGASILISHQHCI